MSHFYHLVLINKGAAPIQGEVDRLMEPFDESFKVDPYEVQCSCVGFLAEVEADKQAQEAVGAVEDIRANFWKNLRDKSQANKPSKEIDKRWKEAFRPYQEARELFLTAHPLFKKPDKKCEECKGSGKRMTQYNPQSKWDWYEIGGRWDGLLFGQNERGKCLLEDNMMSVSGLLIEIQKSNDLVPFSLLSPDGCWYEKGSMGWWAIVTNAKEQLKWDQEVMELLEQNKECIAVVVDCHI